MAVTPEFFSSAIRESSPSGLSPAPFDGIADLSSSGWSSSLTDIDLGEINAGLIDELGYALADEEFHPANTPYRPGRKLEKILEGDRPIPAIESGNATKVEPTELSKADQAKRKRLIDKAAAGRKSYKPYTRDFAPALQKLSGKSLANVSHSESRHVLLAGGVEHAMSAHLGSAIDALLTQIPKAIAKLPLSYGLGSLAQSEIANAVALPEMNAATERGLIRVATEPIRSTGRIVLSGAMRSITNAGFCGRSIPPHAQDMIIDRRQVRQIEDAIRELYAKQTAHGPASTRLVLDSNTLSTLRENLMEQLLAHQARHADRLVALGVGNAQQRAIAMAFANVSVQIVARVGCSMALSAAGVGVLTPLIALATYPAMAAVTKGVSNWNETNAIARVAIHKYRASRLEGKTFEPQRLEEISHYMQDHFQHSLEANFHRKLDNVLQARLAERQRDIEAGDYRIREMELLGKARTQPELDLAEEIVKTQRKINALNYRFKATRHARHGLQSVPLEYLREDTEVVKSLMLRAADAVDCSNSEFARLLKASLTSLLAVQASPDEDSISLFQSFRDAYERRMGEAITDEQLVEGYEKSRIALEDWLARHVDPLRGPSDEKDFSTGPRPEAHRNGKRLSYIETNLRIVKETGPLQQKRALCNHRMHTLLQLNPGDFIHGFEPVKEKLRTGLEAERAKQLARIQDCRQYEVDLEHFENSRGNLMALDGEVAKHVLAWDHDVPHQIAQFFARDLWGTIKRKGKGEYGLAVGATAGFELGHTSVKSLALTSEAYRDDMSPQQESASAASSRTRMPRSTKAVDPLPFLSDEKTYRARIDKSKAELVAAQNLQKEKAAPLEALRVLRADKRLTWAVSFLYSLNGDPAHHEIYLEAHRRWHTSLQEMHRLKVKAGRLEKAIATDTASMDSALNYQARRSAVQHGVSQFGLSGKDSSALYDSLLTSVRSLNQEHQPGLLALMMERIWWFPEDQQISRANTVWAEVEELDLFRRVDFFDELFDPLSGGERLRLVGQLIDVVEKTEPRRQVERLEWAAYALQKLDLEDRSSGALRIMELVKSLPESQRDHALFQLGVQIQNLNAGDRVTFFDQACVEVNQLPVAARGCHLLGLICRIADLPENARALRYVRIANSVGGVLPQDRALLVEQLARLQRHLLQADRPHAFDAVLRAMAHLTVFEQMDARAQSIDQLWLLPPGRQVDGFRVLTASTLVNLPAEPHQLPGGKNGCFSEDLAPISRIDFLCASVKLDIDGSKADSTGFSSFVPRRRLDGAVELNELIGAIPKADSANRKIIFDDLLACTGKIRFAESKLQPLAVLASQISCLGEAEQQNAFDAFAREADKIGLKERAALWARCITALPEKFRATARAAASAASAGNAADSASGVASPDERYSRALDSADMNAANGLPAVIWAKIDAVDLGWNCRRAIAKEIWPLDGIKLGRQIVYEIVTSSDTNNFSTWHVADDMSEVEERAMTGNVRIRRVLEVHQRSNIYGQFEVLGACRVQVSGQQHR